MSSVTYPCNVLIVDDDVDIREALVDVLADHGYPATAVANGREALDYLHAGDRPCLILLDLMMPVMNGAQFRAAQLGDPALRDLPVLLISAGNDLEQRSAALATESMRKPIDLSRLLEVVARHC
ncbi:MAG: response regulator [Polyangiales bacterium]